MKSLMSLWSCTADELAVRCCTSAARDKTTVASRVEHEGISFLAISLADFGKAIQKWLDQGHAAPSDLPAFKRGKGGRTGLPAFLSGFLERVFDPSSGALLEKPCIEAIYAVLQLTLGFSKIALPEPTVRLAHSGNGRKVVSPKRERRAMQEYIQCEQDVKAADAALDSSKLDDLERMSAMLFGDLFSAMEDLIYWGQAVPKHGPGAVADRLSSNGKFCLRSWTARLQQYYYAEDFLIVNQKPERVNGLYDELSILEPKDEMPVRVICVPKTMKTPRIIAIEPTAMQYAQQAAYRVLRDLVAEDDLLNQLIGFRDQEPNRRMARRGSLRRDLATLDLSEASDRVSNQHVLAMLRRWPLLQGAIQASRSRKADVPGYGVIRFAKFASMGSALCFPMEAMAFLAIIFLGIERELSAPLSCRSDVIRFGKQVRVFGDDIVVPVRHVRTVVEELSDFGHKVNLSKSFWSGSFRESCGRMYYAGQDVSIVKVRRVLPTRLQDVEEVESAVAYRNLAYKAGLWQTARWMDDYLRKVLKAFPNVSSTSSLLGRVSFLGYEYSGIDPNTHGPVIKGHYVRSEPPSDKLEGEGALLKCLLPDSSVCPVVDVDRDPLWYLDLPSVDDDHLERSGRPERVSIKLGVRSPF